jgi:hypothetical protein
MAATRKHSISFMGGFPVNPLAWQESKKGKPTRDIYGRNFRAWSPKLDHVGLLLKMFLKSSNLPLTTFARTWSASVTALGFGNMKLRLSAPCTGGCESFLWRTPSAVESGINPDLLEPIQGGEMGVNGRHYNRETGRLAQYGLSQQVKLSTKQTLWRTPKADDPNHGAASKTGILKRLAKGQSIRLQDQVIHPMLFRTPDAGCARGAQSQERFAESREKGLPLSLNDQIAHLWATPSAMDFLPQRSPEATEHLRTGAKKGAKRPSNLREQVDPETMKLWEAQKMIPTPQNRDYRTGEASRWKNVNRSRNLNDFTALYPTPTTNDSKNNNPPSQQTVNGRHSDQLNVVAGGSLNPDWVEWLQGFPLGWTIIGA